jgi:hypothetical protein
MTRRQPGERELKARLLEYQLPDGWRILVGPKGRPLEGGPSPSGEGRVCRLAPGAFNCTASAKQ